MTFILTSTSFENGSDIPTKYTCQDDDISPPLHWSNIPPAAKNLVLIVDDPDAPDPKVPKMTWEHWKALTTGNEPVTVDLARLLDDIVIFSNCMRWIRCLQIFINPLN